MKILIACEESGTVREAFAKLGHDTWSCDLQESSQPGKHIVGDVLPLLKEKWDLVIAHPPCTFITNTGVSWLTGKKAKTGRWGELSVACLFFNACKSANADKVCVENPIPHKYATLQIGQYSQLIQPYMFGHLERKATCLWLKGLPLLVETNNVKSEMIKLPKNQQQRLHYLPPSPERAKLRSKTFQGIADAMADQWRDL